MQRSSIGVSTALLGVVILLTGFTVASRSAERGPDDRPLVSPRDQASLGLSADTTFSDRRAILETIEVFYIGDHTGSLEHKVASMHPWGAYRYVDSDGEYQESTFEFVESSGDTLYTEELLSVEIYENVALARLRLENQRRRDEAEYKLMTLHKTDGRWLITSIAWGWGVIQ